MDYLDIGGFLLHLD